VVAGTSGRELTGTQLKGSHVADRALEVAMCRLVVDGVVRTSEDVVVRGGYMGWDDARISAVRFRDFAGCTFVLRENYIPKGKDKITKFKAAVAASRLGDDSAYQKMAASVTYGDYLEFMKSGFIQKSTNALHDVFCSRGLAVSNASDGEFFKVYGDDSMFNAESGKGAAHSGVTANNSRDSIYNILNTGTDQGLTAASILDRLPSHVSVPNGSGGTVVMDIATWHNTTAAGSLRAQCEAEVFPGMAAKAKEYLLQKGVPGLVGGDLGKISQDEGVHGADAF
jgi:hypothetical protein